MTTICLDVPQNTMFWISSPKLKVENMFSKLSGQIHSMINTDIDWQIWKMRMYLLLQFYVTLSLPYLWRTLRYPHCIEASYDSKQCVLNFQITKTQHWKMENHPLTKYFDHLYFVGNTTNDTNTSDTQISLCGCYVRWCIEGIISVLINVSWELTNKFQCSWSSFENHDVHPFSLFSPTLTYICMWCLERSTYCYSFKPSLCYWLS